ncbi:hypothetical protein [Bradyrhizobium diazoefficiens]
MDAANSLMRQDKSAEAGDDRGAGSVPRFESQVRISHGQSHRWMALPFFETAVPLLVVMGFAAGLTLVIERAF